MLEAEDAEDTTLDDEDATLEGVTVEAETETLWLDELLAWVETI